MNEANARKLLFTVADVLEDIGVEFFLYGGTLLGAAREKRFIKIDLDIDLAILQENLLSVAGEIEKRLIQKGVDVEVVDHRHRKPWDGTIYAIKFHGYGINGDLSGFVKMQGKRVVPSHIGDFWIVHTAAFLEELGEIEFYGRTFKAPKDIESLLTEKYGNWQIPHTEFYNVSKNRKPESWMEDTA